MRIVDLIARLQKLPPEGEVRLTERDLSRLFGRLEAERIAREEEWSRIRRECADYARRSGISLARAVGEWMFRSHYRNTPGEWERVKPYFADSVAQWEAISEKDIAEAGGEEAWLVGALEVPCR